MPIMRYRTRTLVALSGLIPEITYVMCGARGETSSRLLRALPQLKFIGFEPDVQEHQRLNQTAGHGSTYLNAAVGVRDERRVFYCTRNPGCSSLLRPNHAFCGSFKDCGPDLEVVEEKVIDTVSLDSFLPKFGVKQIDFLDLDTQGSELEILHGAGAFLSADIAAVKCEVEFSPLYQEQPMFSDVDAYLRRFGFMLFDMSRSRYRRANFPPHALTRGQLLWGDALYLRDYAWFVARSAKLPLFKLCLIAAHLQFHDYALAVLDSLLEAEVGTLTAEERSALTEARRQYLTDLAKAARWIDLLQGFEAVGLRRPIKLLGRLASQLGERLRKDTMMTEYNWVD
jgi:FkbM family methyltransferase